MGCALRSVWRIIASGYQVGQRKKRLHFDQLSGIRIWVNLMQLQSTCTSDHWWLCFSSWLIVNRATTFHSEDNYPMSDNFISMYLTWAFYSQSLYGVNLHYPWKPREFSRSSIPKRITIPYGRIFIAATALMEDNKEMRNTYPICTFPFWQLGPPRPLEVCEPVSENLLFR